MLTYKRIGGDYAEYLCDESEAELLLRAIGSDIPRPCKVFVTVIHVGLDMRDLHLDTDNNEGGDQDDLFACSDVDCIR